VFIRTPPQKAQGRISYDVVSKFSKQFNLTTDRIHSIMKNPVSSFYGENHVHVPPKAAKGKGEEMEELSPESPWSVDLLQVEKAHPRVM